MSPEAVLAWKLRLLVAGAGLLLLGIVLDRRPLVLASIVLFGAGLVLRILYRPPPQPRHASWDEPEPPDAPSAGA